MADDDLMHDKDAATDARVGASRSTSDSEVVDSRESWLAELARAPAMVVGPAIGESVGDEYVIERVLGEGAMGTVYLAHHGKLQRKVAIKLHRMQSDQAAAGLLAEARAVAQVQHENVLVVHGVGTWKGHVFVAMEFVDGPTARQWVKATPRSWREIVELYTEAGRGLAAAHARGLVHRDFKPDNVLVPWTSTGRGRVKVADFGLARWADGEISTGDWSTSSHAPRSTTRGLVGSPAYMAPEQYVRADVDARADQFAFCVSLFEALFGRRPFDGDDLATLGHAIATGRFREPDGVDVPLHVRRVIRRGLSPEPDQRFADMPALLGALARDPTVQRRRALGAIAAVAVGASVTWAATREVDPLPACVQSPDIAGWWTAERGAELRTAFRASGREHADTTFARVDETLSIYRDEASALLVDGCRATFVDGTRARVELEAQRSCLGQRARELEALLDVLGRGTPEITDRATAAAEGLTPVTRCERPDALEPDDSDPGVEAALQSVARTRSLRLVGRFEEASTTGRAELARVRGIGRPRVLADLLLQIATSEASLNRVVEASDGVREAAAAAVLGGDDALAAEIAAEGLFIDGYRRSSAAQGEQWAKLGWAWLERAQWPRDVLRELLAQRGLARRTVDRHVEALLDLSLALAMAQGERDTAVRAGLLAALGETYRRMGLYDEARSTAVAAIDAYVAALGERHPYSINALNLLASVDLERGRFAEAEATLRRGLELGEAVLGPSSPRLVDARVNLSTVLFNTGRLAEAIALQQRAYDDVSRPDEPRDERRVLITANLANDLAVDGRLERARELNDEAVALAREIAGADSALYARQIVSGAELAYEVDPARAHAWAREGRMILARIAPDGLDHTIALAAEGIALALLERCDEAEPSLSVALTKLRATVGDEHPGLAGALAATGHCDSIAGRHDRALEHLDHAARLNDSVLPPNPIIVRWQALARVRRGDRAP